MFWCPPDQPLCRPRSECATPQGLCAVSGQRTGSFNEVQAKTCCLGLIMPWSLSRHALLCSVLMSGGLGASCYWRQCTSRQDRTLLMRAMYSTRLVWQGSVWFLDRVIYLVGDNGDANGIAHHTTLTRLIVYLYITYICTLTMAAQA